MGNNESIAIWTLLYIIYYLRTKAWFSKTGKKLL